MYFLEKSRAVAVRSTCGPSAPSEMLGIRKNQIALPLARLVKEVVEIAVAHVADRMMCQVAATSGDCHTASMT
jgi:hypothetical protein